MNRADERAATDQEPTAAKTRERAGIETATDAAVAAAALAAVELVAAALRAAREAMPAAHLVPFV